MRCWMSRIGWSGAAFVGLLAIGATPQEPLQEPLFTRDERLKVLEYWANPERYASSLPSNASKVGVWQVRLSEKASKWLWDYRKALNLPKIPPGEVPPPLTPEQQGWENWIDARVAWDRWQAGKTSEERNAQRQGRKPAFDEPQPPNPGPIPAALFDLAGEPPAFADVVSPRPTEFASTTAYRSTMWITPTCAHGTPTTDSPRSDVCGKPGPGHGSRRA